MSNQANALMNEAWLSLRRDALVYKWLADMSAGIVFIGNRLKREAKREAIE